MFYYKISQSKNMKISYLILTLFFTVSLMSCSRHHAPEHDHDHEDVLQLTAYSDEFEVFIEATPFAVGEGSEVLAHFTNLNDFKPLAGVKVAASLEVGSLNSAQTVEGLVEQGIWKFEITPAAAGNGELIFEIQASEGASRLVVEGIEVFEDEHDARHAAHEAHVSESNAIVFTKEQSWKVDFATEKVKRATFSKIIRTTAQILPAQIDEKVVVAKAGGTVLFSGNEIVEGKAVRAAQTLFSIESKEFADNNLEVKYVEAVSEYNRAKADYNRKKELFKELIVSERDLLEAETAFKNAEVVYNNLNRNFSSGSQTVSSPINGFIKQLLVRNGEFAETGQPVLVVSKNTDLLVKADLQPKYHQILSTISSANLKVMGGEITYSLEELDGKLVSYGKTADLANPLIPVVFQVKNNIGLLPGSFVEMYIKLLSGENEISVPNNAIVEEMGAFFVFVQITPELFEKRPVKKGATDGFRTQIIEGVSENERIVSKGAVLVKLAQAAGALDIHSGHVH